MSTDPVALEPCPFCHGEAEIVRRGTMHQSMIVACTSCGCNVESGDVAGLTAPEHWRWNRRPALSAAPRWLPIEEAPRDGTPLALLTRCGYLVKAAWIDNIVVGDNDIVCGAWASTEEEQHPPCWTDGVCWASNADEEPSDPPVLYMRLPAPPEGDTK